MIDQIPPELLCVGAIVALGVLAVMFTLKPAWGCGGVIAIIGLAVLGFTTNGQLAIMGAVVVGVVFVMAKLLKGGQNINIENSGDNVNITVNT